MSIAVTWDGLKGRHLFTGTSHEMLMIQISAKCSLRQGLRTEFKTTFPRICRKPCLEVEHLLWEAGDIIVDDTTALLGVVTGAAAGTRDRGGRGLVAPVRCGVGLRIATHISLWWLSVFFFNWSRQPGVLFCLEASRCLGV